MKYRTISSLAHRRAHVELIDYSGTLAIRKTFPDYARGHLKREIAFRRRFAKLRDEIPRVLEHSDDFVIYPYHDGTPLMDYPNPFPIGVLKRYVDVLRFLYDHNYVLIDSHPGNVIVCPDSSIILIDFEFATVYPQRPPTFYESWDFVGVPEGFTGAIPKYPAPLTYDYMWSRRVGVSHKTLIRDPAWLVWLKRNIAHSLTKLRGR